VVLPGVQRQSFIRRNSFVEECKYTRMIRLFVYSRQCVAISGSSMLSMNGVDCIRHQLQNKFSVAEFENRILFLKI